jgi:peptide/nickel transport system substrate-binding protein
MLRKRRLHTAWKAGAALGIAAIVLGACGSTATGPTNTTNGNTTTTAAPHVKGGTIYWAEGPAVTPNWIFPFADLAHFSVANLTQFQYLMYRPLYWFGPNGTTAPTVDYTQSLANAPVFTNGGKTVTVPLKGWKFKDGQVVDAQSVVFWMNMMKAEGASAWAGYVPGNQAFPGNVVSYSASSPTALSVTFQLSESFSDNWYIYNELSQINPMPEAWDVTSLTGAAGSGGCGKVSAGAMTGAATMAACKAVWTFDSDNGATAKNPQMAGDLKTYGTNPLWADGADGPWYLSAFDASSGEATFVPNTAYSGAQPIISKFIEVPYTTDTAEFNALAAGGSSAPQVGYIPPQNVPQYSGAPGGVGANASQLAGHYTLVPFETWQINYFPENFNSTGDGGNAGAIFHQLYFRQALQELVDQNGIIKGFYRGYGVPTYGPVPVFPANPFATPVEKSAGGPYPFSLTSATNLLKSHGWTINAGGTDTCAKAGSGPGQCGAGIAAGAQLNFLEEYASGSATLTQAVQYEVSEWSKAGIHVTTKAASFNNVLKYGSPCAKGPSCTWEMANWGGGWIYAPDYLPTGEEIFATGAGSNSGSYNDPTNNSEIIQTNRNSSLSVFQNWENYLAEQLPVIWQPISSGLAEISNNIGGVTPINALLNLNPEYWYCKTSTC